MEDYKQYLDKVFIYKEDEEEEESEEEDLCTLEYQINNEEKNIRIFGNKFVENNKNNCYIIYGNKKSELSSYYHIKTNRESTNSLKIKLKIVNPLNDISFMFNKCSNLKSIKNIEIFKTFKFTNLERVFAGCYLLNNLPNEISDWKTEDTYSMEGLFFECLNLSSLPNIGKWNTSNITSMKEVFFGCRSLAQIPDISRWNTSKVTSMNSMFCGCLMLKFLPDLSKWDTSNVTNIGNIFEGCSLLQYLPDISEWRTDNFSHIEYMLSECSSLKSLPKISRWNMANVTQVQGLFNECKSLEFLDDGISEWRISKIINMDYVFQNCQKLKKIPDISKWDTSNISSMKGLFYGCKSLTELPDISKWKFNNNLKDIIGLFYGCSSLEKLPDLSKWKIININSLEVVFYECSSLKNLPDISLWKTNNVKSMNSLFYGCTRLEFLPDLSKWNTDNLIDIGDIFNDCNSLKALPDISKWNTSKVIAMNNVFYKCSSLTKLPDISKWDTQNVEDLSNIFYGCLSLEALPDISKWKTNKVNLMNGLFYECETVISLPEISKWDISNVFSMNVMFYCCKNLQYLPDLSIWNTKKVKTMNMMFFDCFSLRSLPDIVNKWDISSLTSINSMFYRCHSLDQLPEINKWFEKKEGIDLCYLFYGCNPSLFIDDPNKWTEYNIKIMIEDSKNNDIIFSYELIDDYKDKSLKNKEKFIRYFNINKEYILCKRCFKFPLIKLNSSDNLSIKCECSEIDSESSQYLIDNYIINKEETDFLDKISSEFYCKEHIKKFKYYCKNCQKDFCRECLRSTSYHSSHIIIYFASYIYKIQLKIQNIKNIFYRKDSKYNKDIGRIITILANNYYKYYNYHYIQTIENFYTFFFSQRKELILKKEIKEEKDLRIVHSIIIGNEDFNDLSILCNENLINLELLSLKGNCIEDISPLINAKFKNLKYLNLEDNKIGDKNIEYIEQFYFKNLLEFKIYSNCLTNFDFFKTIYNFPKLKVLHAGKNNFDKNKNESFNESNNNFKLYQLEEIGLSNEVFTNDSIFKLMFFKFDALKVMHLNKSNLISLNFVDVLDCPNLEEFWLNDNQLEVFMPLTKYKNLRKIEMNSNKINNISNLIKFIQQFKILEKIDLKYNYIDLNDLNNIKIINSIKNEGKVKLFITQTIF